MFDELVVRVVAGLGRAAAALDDDAARAMIERMSAVQAALAVVDHPARRGELPGGARAARRAAAASHGLVQGRATRLLHDAGRWSPATVEARLGRALTPGTPAAAGAAFVEGFLAGSGTVLLHDAQLLAAVDALGRLAARRLVRGRRGAAAADVRRVRAGRAAPARRPAGHRAGSSGRRRWATTSTRPGARRAGDRAGDARPAAAARQRR